MTAETAALVAVAATAATREVLRWYERRERQRGRKRTRRDDELTNRS